MKTKTWLMILGIALAVFVFAGPREAAAQSPGDKLARGFAGMTCGFMELPGNIYDTSVRHGAAEGWTLGLLKGIAMIPARTLVGVYEFVTFPIPAPPFYQPVLNPSTPFGYWNSSLREQSLAVILPPPSGGAIPYGIRTERPALVRSPWNPNGPLVDVTGYAPGSAVKDPTTGRNFIVP